MQLTIGNNGTVYNLDEDDREEVALFHDIQDFSDNPIAFATTGFMFSTFDQTIQSNGLYTLGLLRS